MDIEIQANPGFAEGSGSDGEHWSTGDDNQYMQGLSKLRWEKLEVLNQMQAINNNNNNNNDNNNNDNNNNRNGQRGQITIYIMQCSKPSSMCT